MFCICTKNNCLEIEMEYVLNTSALIMFQGEC